MTDNQPEREEGIPMTEGEFEKEGVVKSTKYQQDEEGKKSI